MKPREFLHQRQADARAFVRTGARVLDAVEPLEHARQVRFGNTDAGIRDSQLDAVAGRAQFDRDLAFERELERVREQIQDDLLPHVAIDVDGFAQRIAGDDQGETGLFDRRPEDAGELGRELREVGGFIVRVDAAGLDAREIQQRVDEPQKPESVTVRDLLPFAVHRRQRCVRIAQTVFERPNQQRQRRAELVTHVAEERRFRAVQFGERLGSLPLLLVRPGVGEPGSQLIGDQLDERAVLIVKRDDAG